MRPEPRESVPVTCTRRTHIVGRKDARVCVCLIVRASVARGFVLVHVYSSRYYVTPCIEVSDPDVRTERARRLSDFRARIAVKNHENSADACTFRGCILPTQPCRIFRSSFLRGLTFFLYHVQNDRII